MRNVQAGEFYQFILHETIGMSEHDCMLIERYYDKHSKRLSFPGTLDNNGCWVAMSFEEYERLFAFCYLAGTGRHYMDTGQSAECFIQKTAEEYLFLAHVSQDTPQKNSQMACYFTCVAKQAENRQILSGDKGER